ncbi:MAG: aminopeptidase P N-terminal domain-containing protein [Myxococcota bacterium]
MTLDIRRTESEDQEFAAHRQRVLDRLAPDEAVLVFGAPEVVRNGDSEYAYRPQSMVWWLTGWEDPEVAVFLRPGEQPFTMFVQPKDKEREVWTGRRDGPDGARAKFGADVAHPIGDLATHLPKLLQGVRALHFEAGVDPEHDALVWNGIARAAKQARTTGLSAPETFHLHRMMLDELRMVKSPTELERMRAAAALTGEGHRLAMARARPGMWEYEIEADLVHLWRRAGSTGPGYVPIVASGPNATVLHYHTNRSQLADGDLVLLDAGCEVSWYTADVTRTFPVSGRFSPAQRDVYEWVLRAQLAAIERCRPGGRFGEVHDVTVRVLTEGMIALGLLQGTVEERIADEAYKRYYMHGTSHWLGLDVHDVGWAGRDGATRAFAPGMVLTVEPGLYIDPDDLEAPAHLRGIGVRIEDDVLVTDGAPDVLTDGIPKSVDDVERACAASV